MFRGDEMNKNKRVGEFCKDLRTHTLKLTLKEFCNKTSYKISTLSAFENGRSSNMKILFSYLNMVDKKDRMNYLNEVANIIKEYEHG